MRRHESDRRAATQNLRRATRRRSRLRTVAEFALTRPDDSGGRVAGRTQLI